MAVEWNGAAARATVEDAVGALLLRLAVTVQTRARQEMGKGNARPYADSSRPGEYLKRRTGWGTAHLVYQPATAAAAGRAGRVRLGFTENAWYMAWWEVRSDAQRRKGLIDLVEEMRPQLEALGRGGSP